MIRRIEAHRAAANAAAPPAAPEPAADIPTDRLRAALRLHGDEEPATVLSNPLTGSVLAGRYRLVSRIGNGGAGQVWRAHDRTAQQDVAIKILNAAAGSTLDLDRLLAREGRLLATLSHPGIVRIHDAGRDAQHRYLVMDLVDGVGLDALLAELGDRRRARGGPTGADLLELVGASTSGDAACVRPADPWTVAATRLFVELLRALEAAHGVGVVHRDLKPANVRVTSAGAPVLLDFGMGLFAGKQPGTLTSSMFGTPAYASPEQWQGVRLVGVHTDIYQAGVVFYELLTLERCFDGTSRPEIMRRICAAEFARPRAVDPRIPAALEDCVLRAMARRAEDRYRWAGEFREDLARWLESAPQDGGPAGSP